MIFRASQGRYSVLAQRKSAEIRIPPISKFVADVLLVRSGNRRFASGRRRVLLGTFVSRLLITAGAARTTWAARFCCFRLRFNNWNFCRQECRQFIADRLTFVRRLSILCRTRLFVLTLVIAVAMAVLVVAITTFPIAEILATTTIAVFALAALAVERDFRRNAIDHGLRASAYILRGAIAVLRIGL